MRLLWAKSLTAPCGRLKEGDFGAAVEKINDFFGHRKRANKASYFIVCTQSNNNLILSRCGAVGSAPALGAGCRRFKSCHLDHTECSYSNREVFCKNTLFRFHILTNCFYTAVVAGVAAGT